jgi:hypothetical protein
MNVYKYINIYVTIGALTTEVQINVYKYTSVIYTPISHYQVIIPFDNRCHSIHISTYDVYIIGHDRGINDGGTYECI